MFLDMLTEFTDHIAVRKILLGIRDRAEGHPEPMLEQIGEMALWLVAAVQFVIALILLFRRSRWLPAWVLALLSALVLQLALYAPTLWAVVVLMEGIILFGLIRTSRRTSPPLSETPQRMHQASG